MATFDDVRRIALALPDTAERIGRGNLQWKVHTNLFVWDRPLRQSDLDALGVEAPTGEILGARVPDEGAKFALIADRPDVYFTTPHFNGYPAILVRLDVIGIDDLEELIVEAWLLRAPKKLAARYLADHA